jgi:hypothetical protein
VSLNTCSTTSTVLHQRTDSTGTTDVTPANNGLSIDVAPGAWVNDIATVSAGATGSVKFKYYAGDPSATPAVTPAAQCAADATGTTSGTGVTTVSTGVALSGGTPNTATSAAAQFNTVGDFYWRAFYLGDGLSPSASLCNEIVHVIQVNTAISTSPFYYPNDSATLSAPNGGGTLAGSIVFKAYIATASPAATALENCTANGAQGLLFAEPSQTVNGVGPYTTTNTTNAVSADGRVYFRVTFTSTNASQKGRNSVCVENINATLTGDSPGSVGNTP